MITSIRASALSPAGLIRRLTDLSVERDLSYAIWRKPGSISVNMILSASGRGLMEVSPEHEVPGFAMAPFDPASPGLFLPADHLFRFTKEEGLELTGGDLIDELPTASSMAKNFHQGPDDPGSEPLITYRELVESCIAQIRSGYAQKLVPTRCKRVPLAPDADPVALFERLDSAYPDAFVSLVSTPQTGTWIGATPELLVEVDKDNIFRTVALAGTKPYHDGMNINEVAWTQKEIEEQALVERYIIGCFKKIRVREYDEFGPRTVRAGNLLHLRSDFSVDQKEVRYPDLATVMLRLMHPTSAVCGTPGDLAMEFLRTKEGYDRRFYSGYLGPVNIDQETGLYVNLRCMKWLGTEALLFAGAGVTAASDPEQEWQETRFKMDTLRKFL